MKWLIAAVVFASVFSYHMSEAGRSGSGGYRSSGSRSYSTPSLLGKSYSSPRSSVSEAPKAQTRTQPAPTVVERHTTTVIHDHGGGIGGNGLLAGVLIGHALSQPATVVQAAPQQVVVSQEQSSGHGVFWYLFWAAVIVVCGYFAIKWLNDEPVAE